MSPDACRFLICLAIACSLAAAACGGDVAVPGSETGSGAGSTTSTTTGAGGATTTTVTTTTTTSTTTTSTSSSTGTDVAKACADYWEAACTEYETCYAASSLIYFGDHATCIARMTATCVNGVFADGATTTPANVVACGAALTNLDCASYAKYLARETDLGGCAYPPGTLPVGAVCGAATQCDTLVCDIPANKTCGVCALGEPGAPCQGSRGCGIGLRCAQGSCVTPGQLGDPCNNAKPCSSVLTCLGGACANRLPIGSTCNPQANDSPCEAGLVCNPISEVCETFDVGPLGAACGLVADGTLDYCVHATFCDLDSPTEGTCVTAIADGEPCTTQTNGFEPCTYPARCFQGSCHYPDATTCTK